MCSDMQNRAKEHRKIDGKPCPVSDKGGWEKINFKKATTHVRQLQDRLTTALLNNDFVFAEGLTHLLLHSFYAKALAVENVSTNRGKHTHGVDGIVLDNVDDKYQMIYQLHARGYRANALLRKAIPKANGKVRYLGIPTMKDRAMQTLYSFALEPYAEITGDRHSYGFRKNRCAKDAIWRCLDVLESTPRPRWILEADIEACFDNISHDWLLENVPMDKRILREFLKANYMENGHLYPVEKGTPQGGAISPMLCNIALDGLEQLLIDHLGEDVHFIRYADDIIVIGTDEKVLQAHAIPLIEDFLSVRGLHLSKEKTVITNIADGFDFLGWRVQRKEVCVEVVPSDRNHNSLVEKVDAVLSDGSISSAQRKQMLSRVVKGWLEYHRNVVPVPVLCQIGQALSQQVYDRTQDAELTELAASIFN